MWHFCMKLGKYNDYSVSTVDTDALVLKHQGISSHSADYISMWLPQFMG